MTNQVLAFTERPEFKALLEFECKALTGFAPVVHQTLEDLESMLEIFPVVEVLVVDTPQSLERFHHFIGKVLERGESLKNVLVIGEGEMKASNMRYFPRGEEGSLMGFLKNALGNPEVKEEGWVSVPLTALNHFKKLPFDLYVKLSEEKYVKRIPSLEEIDLSTIESFKQRGIEELHFHREHNKDFSRMLINNMLEKLDTEYEDEHDQLKARSEVHGTVKEIVQSLGLAPKVVEVCDSIVGEITKDMVQEGGKLGKHLARLKNSNLAFHYRFIELTCYIGTQLLMSLDEKNYASEIKRFVFAAYFCDITLNDDEHYHHFNLDSMKMLKTQQQREVHDHAWKAANLVAKYRNAPSDVAIVIKQHHGAMDGSGFPLKKSPHLTNLTKCLIISQELAYGMLTNSHKPAVEVLKSMVKKHSGSGLEELVQLFESSLLPEAV